MNDLEKFQETVGSIESIPTRSLSRAQLYAALALAQGEFEAPQRTKTAKVKGRTANGSDYSYEYKYAPLEEVIRVLKPALAKNGLGYKQETIEHNRRPFMLTIVFHSSGEWDSSIYPIHIMKDGAQGFGSASTYARRYALCLMFGLAPEDDDDNTETSAVGSPRMAEQPVPSSRSHSSPLDGSEREGTGDLETWKSFLALAAEQGMETLRRRWGDVPASLKKNLMPELTNNLKPRAAEVDAKDRS